MNSTCTNSARSRYSPARHHSGAMGGALLAPLRVFTRTPVGSLLRNNDNAIESGEVRGRFYDGRLIETCVAALDAHDRADERAGMKRTRLAGDDPLSDAQRRIL